MLSLWSTKDMTKLNCKISSLRTLHHQHHIFGWKCWTSLEIFNRYSAHRDRSKSSPFMVHCPPSLSLFDRSFWFGLSTISPFRRYWALPLRIGTTQHSSSSSLKWKWGWAISWTSLSAVWVFWSASLVQILPPHPLHTLHHYPTITVWIPYRISCPPNPLRII
jgi:hypothetical protein